jgi:hypothetical protein
MRLNVICIIKNEVYIVIEISIIHCVFMTISMSVTMAQPMAVGSLSVVKRQRILELSSPLVAMRSFENNLGVATIIYFIRDF